MLSAKNRWWLWGGFALTLALGMIFIWLVAAAAIDKKVSIWASGFLFILGAASVAFALSTSILPGHHWRSIQTWLKPQTIVALFIAFVGAFSLLTDALSLLEERTAIESAPGALESKLNILVDTAQTEKVIDKAINGLWGRPGCQVAFEFTVTAKAVVANFVRHPTDSEPFTFIGTIMSQSNDVIEVRGEQPSSARGKVATFTYWTNGVSENLTWDDQISTTPVKFERCT